MKDRPPTSLLRVALSFIGNWLTAALGTATWGEGLGGRSQRDGGLSSGLLRLLQMEVGFGKVGWVAGMCGLVWAATLGSPRTPYEMASLLPLVAVSVRAVSYSLGAMCCAGVRSRRSNNPVVTR
jgi:hypothetical protein